MKAFFSFLLRVILFPANLFVRYVIWLKNNINSGGGTPEANMVGFALPITCILVCLFSAIGFLDGSLALPAIPCILWVIYMQMIADRPKQSHVVPKLFSYWLFAPKPIEVSKPVEVPSLQFFDLSLISASKPNIKLHLKESNTKYWVTGPKEEKPETKTEEPIKTEFGNIEL